MYAGIESQTLGNIKFTRAIIVLYASFLTHILSHFNSTNAGIHI